MYAATPANRADAPIIAAAGAGFKPAKPCFAVGSGYRTCERRTSDPQTTNAASKQTQEDWIRKCEPEAGDEE